MFEGFRFRMAKNTVILTLERDGIVSKPIARQMAAIAGNGANFSFGKSLLKSGVAFTKYAAAAVVFARLAVYAREKQKGEVTFDDWRLASGAAMSAAGLDKDEAWEVSQYLIDQQQQAMETPIDAALSTLEIIRGFRR